MQCNLRQLIYRYYTVQTITRALNIVNRGMVKTATGQNGDKPKRLQVHIKRVNLLSSTMDISVNL